ncbi:unnamed protein product [Pleuronectes platessa]|uniref:Uncharacterized protein n=1 Tax=Pleuronectes platessa TaxID=8262 RepID=A0A9N7UZF4_PLEPL|nr:unnamed protein product [Pleuronectes platessa]
MHLAFNSFNATASVEQLRHLLEQGETSEETRNKTRASFGCGSRYRLNICTENTHTDSHYDLRVKLRHANVPRSFLLGQRKKEKQGRL